MERHPWFFSDRAYGDFKMGFVSNNGNSNSLSPFEDEITPAPTIEVFEKAVNKARCKESRRG
jgi:hypothetical protein